MKKHETKMKNQHVKEAGHCHTASSKHNPFMMQGATVRMKDNYTDILQNMFLSFSPVT
jgi:hypothetical protein